MTINPKKLFDYCNILLLLSWGILLLSIGTNGPFAAVLHPTFRITCFLGAVILLAIAITRAFFPVTYAHQTSTPLLIIQQIILAIPLVLAITIRYDGYSRAALLNRGLACETYTPPLPKNTNSQIYQDTSGVWHITPLDAWIISKSPPERHDFSEAKVSLIGQLLLPRDDSSFSDTRIFRLWVNCCLADATPVAISFSNFDHTLLQKVTDLSWIQAIGRLRFLDTPPYSPKLEITDLRLITTPRESYIFR